MLKEKIRVLLNATTIVNGGGVQATVSMVEHVIKTPPEEMEFIFALNKSITDQMSKDVLSSSECWQFDESPARPISGKRAKQMLESIVKNTKPDVVYSMGFPSYVNFDCPELGRYTNPWEILSLKEAWSRLPLIDRIKRNVLNIYRRYWARKASYFETQTQSAKDGIIKHIGVPANQVYVLSNTCNDRFLEVNARHESPRKTDEPFNILCLAADHWHKNLQIVPTVAELLKTAGMRCIFRLTLPHESSLWRSILDLSKANDTVSEVINIGPISLDTCIAEYSRADCIFQPTLAEVFSATYLEAMAMRVPITTSDIDFAHDICGPAAAYFDPVDPNAAAQILTRVLTSENYREKLINAGTARLAKFASPEEKYNSLIQTLRDIHEKNIRNLAQ